MLVIGLFCFRLVEREEGSDAIQDFNFPRVKLEEVGYACKVHLHVMTFS